MAKLQIKSEKLTPFGGIFSIMEQFDSTVCHLFYTERHSSRLTVINPSNFWVHFSTPEPVQR